MKTGDHSVGVLSQIKNGTVSWAAVGTVVAAAALGVFILIATGFAGSEVLHNAAHDVRHGISFPCH